MTSYSLVERFVQNVGICVPIDVVSDDNNITMGTL
jgi:hypothetical protein